MRHFTKQEDDFIRSNFLTMPAKRMAKALGRCEGTARQRMKLLGIIVPTDVILKFKQASYIKKGNVPANKGKKQADYMSQEAINKCAKSRFKAGDLPHNTKKDFEISVRPDNRGVKYNFIRVSLSKWVPLHRFLWEKENGKLPSKMKLVFKDGDTMNCDISNLEMLTPAQLMARNTYHNYPKPIAEIIQLRGALTRQINKHLKKTRNEK